MALGQPKRGIRANVMDIHANVTAVSGSQDFDTADKGVVRTPSKRRPRSIRVPLKWLIVAGAGVGIVAGLGVSVASNYLTIMIRQARDGYVVYRLSAERDELRATKQRLEREMLALQQNSSRASAYEATIKGRLEELNSVVEASTALGLFKRDKRNRQTNKNAILAQDATKKRSDPNALAAILDSPVLADSNRRKGRNSAVIDEMRARNRGLGGAEVECRRNSAGKIVCAASVAKEEVAYTDVRAALKPEFSTAQITQESSTEEMSEEQRELLAQLEYYTETLRSLPIGSPVTGEITSKFGRRLSPFSGHSTHHEGIDIALEKGTRIRAPGDGIVIKSEYDGAYGWVVDVAHAGKIVTRYAHLSRALVKKGQRIRRGQLIALSGSTGRSTGPHLHYEVRVNGLARNPMPFVALAHKLGKVVS